MLQPDAIPTPRRGFSMEELDGEILIYRPALKKMIYLNESAAVVWQLCDGQRSVQEIVKLLAESYPEAADTIAADVHETIDMLIREGAILYKADQMTDDAD